MDAGRPKDNPPSVEVPYAKVTDALITILHKTRGRAIVNCGGLDQARIVEAMTENNSGFFVSAAPDLIGSQHVQESLPPQGTRGWIVTGYSSNDLDNKNRESESRVQSVIRARVPDTHGEDSGISHLLV